MNFCIFNQQRHQADGTQNTATSPMLQRCAQPIFMIKAYLLIFSFFLSAIGFSQFRQNDTLFFIREKNDSVYHRVFIDTNKNSKFYFLVSSFKISGFDIDTYKRSLNYLHSKRLFLNKHIITKMPREWVLLQPYKGKIYVYSPADYYFHYKVKLTDSLFIDWTGEGPEATYVQKFTELNSSTYKFTLSSQSYQYRELTIKFIDTERGIAIFKSEYYNPVSKKKEIHYQLMADVKKMRKIPLLVNYCDTQKQEELEFDNVDYAEMFMKSN